MLKNLLQMRLGVFSNWKGNSFGWIDNDAEPVAVKTDRIFDGLDALVVGEGKAQRIAEDFLGEFHLKSNIPNLFKSRIFRQKSAILKLFFSI